MWWMQLFVVSVLLGVATAVNTTTFSNASKCTLCVDGTTTSNPEFMVFNGTTCTELDLNVSALDIALCPAIQATAGIYCGCQNDFINADVCRICGGTTLLPDSSIITTNTDKKELVSCAMIEFQASTQLDQCASYQSTFFESCCPNITQDTFSPTSTPAPSTPTPTICYVCGNETQSISLPDVVIQIPENDTVTCGILEIVALGGSILKDDCPFVQSLAKECGCEPIRPCTLCPNGATPGKPDLVLPIQGSSDMTCADIATLLPSVDLLTCKATTQSELPAFCGCPGAGCTLCQDGTLPNPDLLLWDGVSCSALETSVVAFDKDKCDAIQVTGGIYCGCTNDVQTACRICGGDTLLPDISIIAVKGNGGSKKPFTCGEIEFEASTKGSNCDGYQSSFFDICCSAETKASTSPFGDVSRAPFTPAPMAPGTTIPMAQNTLAPITDASMTPAPMIQNAPPTFIDGSITPAPIADGSITPAPIVDGSITPASVPDGSITPAPITDSSITPAPMTDSSITPAPMTDGSITPAPMTDGSITPAPITDGSITPAPITDGSITPAPITDGSITPAPITDGSISKKPTVSPTVLSTTKSPRLNTGPTSTAIVVKLTFVWMATLAAVVVI